MVGWLVDRAFELRGQKQPAWPQGSARLGPFPYEILLFGIQGLVWFGLVWFSFIDILRESRALIRSPKCGRNNTARYALVWFGLVLLTFYASMSSSSID